MRIAVLDYGLGNLHSLVKALEGDGRTVAVEADARVAITWDVLVLPGVGAFGPAASALASARPIITGALDAGLPCLGICLGMQLLCDGSDEGPGAGLGVFSGRVTKLRARRVPHIGWNTVVETNDPAFAASNLTTAYFANSFACRVRDECVIGWSAHETDRFPAAIRRGRVMGVQFHPEKSSAPGLRFVRAALQELVR